MTSTAGGIRVFSSFLSSTQSDKEAQDSAMNNTVASVGLAKAETTTTTTVMNDDLHSTSEDNSSTGSVTHKNQQSNSGHTRRSSNDSFEKARTDLQENLNGLGYFEIMQVKKAASTDVVEKKRRNRRQKSSSYNGDEPLFEDEDTGNRQEDSTGRTEKDQERQLEVSVGSKKSRKKKKKKRTNNDSKKGVVFTNVTIRRYPMIMGDNPACSIGAPVTLDWVHSEEFTLDLEFYLAHRKPYRPLIQMYMNYYTRQQVLTRAGFSTDEWNKTQRLTSRIQKQRRMTAYLAEFWETEHMIRAIGRRLLRIISPQARREKYQPPLETKY